MRNEKKLERVIFEVFSLFFRVNFFEGVFRRTCFKDDVEDLIVKFLVRILERFKFVFWRVI